jgi:hypothetical protein
MDEPSFTSKERATLQRLVALAVDRTRTDLDIEGKLTNGTNAAERDHEKSVEAAQEQRAVAVEEAKRKLQSTKATLERTYATDLAAAEKAMEFKIAAFEERTRTLEQTAEKKLEEAVWIAETLVESGETRGSQEYEQIRLTLSAKNNELDQLVDVATKTLSRRRHRPLPPLAGLSVAQVPTVSTELPAFISERHARAVTGFEKLVRRIDPPLLGPIPILLVVAVGAAGGGTLGARMHQPVQADTVAIAVGVGALAGAVLMGLLRLLMSIRIAPAARGFSQAVFDVRNAVERRLADAAKDRDLKLVAVRRQRDEEVERAKERHAEATAQIKRRREEDEPLIRETCKRAVEDVHRAYRDGLANAKKDHDAAVASADETLAEALRTANERRDTILFQLRTEHDRARHDQEIRWREGMEQSHREREMTQSRAGQLFPAWTDPSWQEPNFPIVVPGIVKFGEIDVDLAALPGGPPSNERLRVEGPSKFAMPAALDLSGKGSLLVQYGADARETAMAAIQNVMLRVLGAFPPGKARFTIMDPVGLGQNFAAFMHLVDYDPLLVSDRIWTDTRHIELKLGDLTEHMENVIQKYLRNEFQTIQEYNERAGEVAEPYRFLVIADFPAAFNENACKKLLSIVTAGARCGVFTLIAADMRSRPPVYVPMAELEKNSVWLSHREGKWVWQDPDFGRWPLRLENAPEEIFTPVVHAAGRRARETGRVQVPFEIAAPLASPDQSWTLDASEELRVPLGRSGATKLQSLLLGRGTSQHVLIAGRTGSGKSTLLHALITNTALWYSPEEVELYLVDFKKGVEFKTYATHALPHARVIAVESEREFGLSVLRKLDAELTRRGNLFRDAGVQDLASFRARQRATAGGVPEAARNGVAPPPVPLAPVPRLLFIVDEFQEFFVEDDKLAQEAALLLDRLVRQGRAFGMHVILGSQTVGGAYSLARSTIGQMAVRIALQCSEADSYLIMSEDNGAARLLTRPGEAIYNDQSGRVEGNSPFQIVWLPDDKRDRFLARVASRLAASTMTPPPPPIVFEGNIPADLAKNHLLAGVLRGELPAGPSTPPRAWLGEAISIKDPTCAVFRRQAGANMLIVGQQEAAVLPVVLSSAVSLLASSAGEAVTPGAEPPVEGFLPPLCLLDGLPADGEESQLLGVIGACLPAHVRITRPGIGPRSADVLLGELCAELDRRQQDESLADRRIFVMVAALHRFRSLRRSDDDFGFSEGPATKPDQQLARLLREGPTLGIHVLVWCDTMANVERALDRRVLREFDQRVAFQMSANDSSALIDSPAAANLGRHRALYHSEELGAFEKFRPYAMPTREYLESACGQIQSRERTGVR